MVGGPELLSERAGLIGAGLLAINPFAIWYAQEARAYSFVVLFAALSFPLLTRALDGRGTRWGALYVLATAAAAYSNFVALLVLLPAHAVLAAAGGGERVRRWLRHLAWLGLALLPLLYLLVHARLERDTLYYLAAPGPRDLVRIAREYLAGYTTTRAIYAAGLGVAAIAVLWAAARARRDMPESIGDALRRPFAVVVTWALLAPGLAFVVSQAAPLFESHFLIAALPGAMLLLGACILALPRPAAAVIVVALAVVMLAGDRWAGTTAMKEQCARPSHSWSSAHRARPCCSTTPSPCPPWATPTGRERFLGDLLVKEWEDRPLPPWLVLRRDPGGYDDSRRAPDPGPHLEAGARRPALGGAGRDDRRAPGRREPGPRDELGETSLQRARAALSLAGREYQDVFVATVERCSA